MKNTLTLFSLLSVLLGQFSAIAQPTNPAKTPADINPRAYGAKGDGATYDTTALQKAIDACGGTGGRVLLGPGRYLTAHLTLHGGMTLELAKGAVLLGGTNADDYPVQMPTKTAATANCRSLLFADKADGLTIRGEGEIDGQCKFVNMIGKEADRPSLIRIFSSQGVTVRDITLRNPRMWTQVYSECSDLLIDHVTVIAPPDCPNLDGMDICDSHDVIIRNCDVKSEDDAICLKSHGKEGLHNILVENNTALSYNANGIKLGTATVGPISHLEFRNNCITGAKYGGLCIESVDGGAVSDIRVTGLDLFRVSQPLFIRLGHRSGNKEVTDLEVADRPTGSIDGVFIEGLRALGTHNATKASCSITGIPGHNVSNITLKDCYFEMPGGIAQVPAMPEEKEGVYPQSNIFAETPASGIFIRHAKGVIFDHVVFGFFAKDIRPWIFQQDAVIKTNNCSDLGLISPCYIPLP